MRTKWTKSKSFNQYNYNKTTNIVNLKIISMYICAFNLTFLVVRSVCDCPFKLWLASSTKVKPCIFVVDEVTSYRLAYYYHMFTKIFKRPLMQFVLLSFMSDYDYS